MIRLVSEQDEEKLLSLCRKDAWDGTELLAAYRARCADKSGADWRRCEVWVGESETQKKNIQYLLCRVGESYRLAGAPRSPTRWEELHAFLQLQPQAPAQPAPAAAAAGAGTAGADTDRPGGGDRRILPALFSSGGPGEGGAGAQRRADDLPAHPQRHHRQRGDRVPEPVGDL